MAKPKIKAAALIMETHREFRRVKRELDPQLLASSTEPGKAHLVNEEMRNIIIAQNVIRPCMEAVFDDLVPFSHLTAMELAIRLASYALSTGPMEDQAKLTNLFLQAFPAAHEMRLAMGVIIRTDWQTDGGEKQANFPDGPITDPKGGV